MSAHGSTVLPFGIVGVNDPRDRTVRILKQAGIHTCPECNIAWDVKSKSQSPIQDDCGHAKCNKCMRKTFVRNALCTQCVQAESTEALMKKPFERTGPQVRSRDVLKEKLGKPIDLPLKFRLRSQKLKEQLQGDTKQGSLATSIENRTISSTLAYKTRPYQLEPINTNDSESQGEWRIVSNHGTVALTRIKPPTSSYEQHGSGACAVTSTTRTIRQVKKKLTIPEFINVIPNDGERPFKCPECGKGFNQQGKLTRHSRIHMGERPFVCLQCNKWLSSSQALRNHAKTHSGEPPFACTSCDKQFPSAIDLKKHITVDTDHGRRGQRKDSLDRDFRHRHESSSTNRTTGVLSQTIEIQPSITQTAVQIGLGTSSSPDAKDAQSDPNITSAGKKKGQTNVTYNEFSPGKSFLCQICDVTLDSRTRYESHIQTHTDPASVAIVEGPTLNQGLPVQMQPPDFCQELVVPFLEAPQTPGGEIADAAALPRNSVHAQSLNDYNNETEREERTHCQLDFRSMNENVMVKVEDDDDLEILWENVNRPNVYPERENIFHSSAANAKAISFSQRLGVVPNNKTDVVAKLGHFKDKAFTFVYDETGSVANVMLN